MIGSLCSGMGGLDLAVEAVTGLPLAWVCENDKHASLVLEHQFPGVPNLGDIKEVDWEDESVMAAPRADALAQHMYDRYCQGSSLEEVAVEFNRSRQSVWKMFNRRGWTMRPVRGPDRLRVMYSDSLYSLGNHGYLRRTNGDRGLLHRQVWTDAHGPIPDGYDIHHCDHNKLNNSVNNLKLLTKAEHTRLHAEEVVPADTPAVDVVTAGYP